MTWNELKRQIDGVLIEHLHERLKKSIDAMLQGGHTKREVLVAVRDVIRRTCRDRRKGKLTLVAVETYLSNMTSPM